MYSHTFLSPFNVLVSSSFSVTAISCLTSVFYSNWLNTLEINKKMSLTIQSLFKTMFQEALLSHSISTVPKCISSFTGPLLHWRATDILTLYFFRITVCGSFLSGKAHLWYLKHVLDFRQKIKNFRGTGNEMVRASFSKANDDSKYAINAKIVHFLLFALILLSSSLSSSPHFKTVLPLF